jgi:hypothetical protein
MISCMCGGMLWAYKIDKKINLPIKLNSVHASGICQIKSAWEVTKVRDLFEIPSSHSWVSVWLPGSWVTARTVRICMRDHAWYDSIDPTLILISKNLFRAFRCPLLLVKRAFAKHRSTAQGQDRHQHVRTCMHISTIKKLDFRAHMHEYIY